MSTAAIHKRTSSSKAQPFFKSWQRGKHYNKLNNSYQMQSTARSFTMFDKIYGQSSSKFSDSRISKNTRKRRINEIERCTNMEQKEQYRQLIEQYRSKTLAETELIFRRKNLLDPKKSIPDSVIDITNTLQAESYNKVSSNPFTKVHKSFSNITNGSYLDTNARKLVTSSKRSIPESSDGLLKPNHAVNGGTEFARKSTVQDEQRGINSELLHTPTRKPSNIDWFSPSSPYLCKNFVNDLVSSYSRRERERKRMLAEEETRARLLKEKREMKEEMLSDMLQAKLLVDLKHKDVAIPELSMEMDEEVNRALIPHPQYEVLIEQFNISITRQHMITLAGLNWLNDEVINFYMELIVARSNEIDNLPKAHAMNTFFYPKLGSQGYKSVRRWTKRVDIFSKDLLFFPIHLGVHWTLAVADFRVKQISYYDSMGGSNYQCLEIIRNYLVSEHEDKKKATLDVSSWTTINKTSDEIPQQLNGSDCGVFTCTFAEFISRNLPLSFHQNDMPLLRRTMVWEILKGKLTR